MIRTTAAAVGVASVALASASHAQKGPGAHCRTTEKMSFAELPPPRLMKGIGTSTLDTSCKPRAEQYVRQGIALLHCFWDFETLRSFMEAARLDPTCATAQWGIVETLDHNDTMKAERKAALAKREKFMTKASNHEQHYLRAALKRSEATEAGAHAKAETTGNAAVGQYPAAAVGLFGGGSGSLSRRDWISRSPPSKCSRPPMCTMAAPRRSSRRGSACSTPHTPRTLSASCTVTRRTPARRRSPGSTRRSRAKRRVSNFTRDLSQTR